MSRLRALLTLGAAGLLSGGCVAAAIPIVAGGSMAGKQLFGNDKKPESEPEPVAVATPVPTEPAGDPTATLTTPEARALALRLQASAAASRPAAPASAESAAASLQAYQSLWAYVERQVAARKAGEAVRSVVLAEGATLDAPRYVPCESKPFAILFDLDESATGSDPDARFRRWVGDGSDEVSAVPGAVEGVDALRREGVQAIFTSARRPSGNNAAAAMLAKIGFGEFVPGKTLILRGGEPPISGDQVRRTVAASYCVVAIVGDALGDFSDTFDAGDATRRPAAATETMVAPLWGAGWFLLPNPVRSTATPTTELPKE